MLHKFIIRISHSIPGILLITGLTSPIWLSLSFPRVFGNFVVIFAVYWLHRAIIFIVGVSVGYYRYHTSLQKNWLDECTSLVTDSLPDHETLPKTISTHSKILPKHLIVIPIGGTSLQSIKRTLIALKNQNYPASLVYISLSFEETFTKKDNHTYKQIIDEVERLFGKNNKNVMLFTHPNNLEHEVPGAASNRSWGNSQAVKVLEQKKEDLSNFITTSPDEDIRLHSEFLGALSYSYLTSKNRIQKFYQTAVYLFSNNYWDVPSIIRTWSMSLSMPVLASSVTHRKNRETWSCYSINLGVMKKVNYWDTSICIDDTPFFWRPFDFFNGEFECEVFYIPLFADAVYHPNKITNLIEQYHQLVRWGWGIISFPIACKVLLENKNIPLSKKFKKLGVMFELFVVVKIAAILFAVSLPILFLIHQDFGGHVYLYSLPKTLSVLMTLLTCCMIPMLYIKYQLLPSHPSDWNKFKQVGHFLIEVPLHFVILYTYAFIPFLIGPLMMMLGKNYEYKIIKKF